MKAFNKNVLLKIVKQKEEGSNILLPEGMEKDNLGEVVSKGELVPPELKVKDKVRFKQYYDGYAFTADNEEYIVLNYEDILLIYNK